MKKTAIGLGIVVLVAGVAAGVKFLGLDALQRSVNRHDPVSLAIYYGGEKSEFLANPDVRDIIENRYRITLQAVKAGSVEMSTTLDTSDKDCIWPSNAVTVELARQSGKPLKGDQTIFNSPIVLYAWADVADALESRGAVLQRADGTYAADVAQLVDLMMQGLRWREDLGLNIYGTLKVFSTDPTKSNSGNIWSALLATALNNGEPPTPAQMETLLPKLTAYFGTMGYMEASSGDLFDNFLKQGMGARPIIVGYENQLIEFLHANALQADLINAKIRVIYPEPTIYASHPLISLTDACGRLEEALSDPEVMDIAWSAHGFRTGLLGVQNDPAALSFTSIPETISSVSPMPPVAVMSEIIEELR